MNPQIKDRTMQHKIISFVFILKPGKNPLTQYAMNVNLKISINALAMISLQFL
jgi:hypothetical protein